MVGDDCFFTVPMYSKAKIDLRCHLNKKKELLLASPPPVYRRKDEQRAKQPKAHLSAPKQQPDRQPKAQVPQIQQPSQPRLRPQEEAFVYRVGGEVDARLYDEEKLIGLKEFADRAKEGIKFFLLSDSDQLFGLFQVSAVPTFQGKDEYQVQYRVLEQYSPLERSERHCGFEDFELLTSSQVAELVRRFEQKADAERQAYGNGVVEQEHLSGSTVSPPSHVFHGVSTVEGRHGGLPGSATMTPVAYNYQEGLVPVSGDWLVGGKVYGYPDNRMSASLPQSMAMPTAQVTYPAMPWVNEPAEVVSLGYSNGSFRAGPESGSNLRNMIDVNPSISRPYLHTEPGRDFAKNVPVSFLNGTGNSCTAQPVPEFAKQAAKQPVKQPTGTSSFPENLSKKLQRSQKFKALKNSVSLEPSKRTSVFERVAPSAFTRLSPHQLSSVQKQKRPASSVPSSAYGKQQPCGEEVEAEDESAVTVHDGSRFWDYKRRSDAAAAAAGSVEGLNLEQSVAGTEGKRRRIKRPDLGQ